MHHGIAKVRKTQRGEVLLEIKKGSADALRSAVNMQQKIGRASKRTRQTVLHLRGLDSLTTQKEIMDTGVGDLRGSDTKM
nr:unnamed protein product [Callosobruchus analis]